MEARFHGIVRAKETPMNLLNAAAK